MIGTLTPPQLAKRWGTKPESVRHFIEIGELSAFDISRNPGVGRPRWRISEDAVRDFEAKRAAGAVVPTRRRKQRRTTTGVISFIK